MDRQRFKSRNLPEPNRRPLDYAQLFQQVQPTGQQLNTDKNTNPEKYVINDSPESGASNTAVNYATATTASPSYGSYASTLNPTVGAGTPITISGDGVAYYDIYITT